MSCREDMKARSWNLIKESKYVSTCKKIVLLIKHLRKLSTFTIKSPTQSPQDKVRVCTESPI